MIIPYNVATFSKCHWYLCLYLFFFTFLVKMPSPFLKQWCKTWFSQELKMKLEWYRHTEKERDGNSWSELDENSCSTVWKHSSKLPPTAGLPLSEPLPSNGQERLIWRKRKFFGIRSYYIRLNDLRLYFWSSPWCIENSLEACVWAVNWL